MCARKTTDSNHDIIKCEDPSFQDQLQVASILGSLAQILGAGYGIIGEKLIENQLYAAVEGDFEEKTRTTTSQMLNCESPEYRKKYFAEHGDPSKVVISKVHPFIECIEEKVNNAGEAIKLFLKENKDLAIKYYPDHIIDNMNIAIAQVNSCAEKHKDYFGEQNEVAVIMVGDIDAKNEIMHDNPNYSM